MKRFGGGARGFDPLDTLFAIQLGALSCYARVFIRGKVSQPTASLTVSSCIASHSSVCSCTKSSSGISGVAVS